TPLKGTVQLAETADSLRQAGLPFTLDIVGTGEIADVSLVKQQLSAHPGVEFHGHRSSAEVATMMGSWDILLHPSWAEGFGIVCLEALATGLPIVAVEGVLPDVLVKQPGVFTARRDHYARFVTENHRRITSGCTEGGIVVDHAEGARLWESLMNMSRLDSACIRPRHSER